MFHCAVAILLTLGVARADITPVIGQDAAARGVNAAADIGCGSKSLNHGDFDAAKAELEKLCGTGPLPSHQNLFRQHGSVVAFLCSYGNGGNPGDFPKEANKTCVTPITGACGPYTAGWVIASGLNITYGLDVSNTTLFQHNECRGN